MGWKGWNKVGTPIKTSIQTSFGHFPYLECPKCGLKTILSLFWPLFGPRRATFGTFLVWQMAQAGLPRCLHWCYNLVPALPTKNRPPGPICVAKRLFLANFCSFLAPVGPHLGQFGCGKWPKLVGLDAFIGVPTLFHPFQPKICPMR